MDWWLTLSTVSGTKISGNGPGGAIPTHSFSVYFPQFGGEPGQGSQRAEIDSVTVVVKTGNWIPLLQEAAVTGVHLDGFLEAHTDSQRSMLVLNDIFVTGPEPSGDGLWAVSFFPVESGKNQADPWPSDRKGDGGSPKRQ